MISNTAFEFLHEIYIKFMYEKHRSPTHVKMNKRFHEVLINECKDCVVGWDEETNTDMIFGMQIEQCDEPIIAVSNIGYKMEWNITIPSWNESKKMVFVKEEER